MSDYDTRTAYLICGVLYQLLPFVAWLVLAGQRSRPVALWCAGSVLGGIAMLLLGLTGRLPAWQTTVLPQTMLICSHFMRIQSLRLDLGRPWKLAPMFVVGLLVLAGFEFLRSSVREVGLRIVYMQTVHAIFLVTMGWHAWRVGQAEGSRNARIITGVYALFAASLVADNIIVIFSGGDLFTVAPRPSAHLVITAAILSSVLGHIGYIGMALDRSVRRELVAAEERSTAALQAAVERARDEERQRLGTQIAALDRQRSLGQLSASLGHELSQPLTAIMTNAQLVQRGLQAGQLGREAHGELLARIVQNTQRAGRIIERIRDYIRPAPPSHQAVDLQALMLEVVSLVADEARSRRVQFVLPFEARPLRVAGDPIQLSQILLNVLRNAIDAVAPMARRQVSLACELREGWAVCRVHDSGPGFPSDLMNNIATPYLTTKAQGLGMGLAVSRSIAAQHQGSLDLANGVAEQGGGAIVELKLPAMLGTRNDDNA